MSKKDKNILSVDSDDDKDMSYLSLSQYLEDDTERKKNRFAREFQEMGDDYLKEIERKKREKKRKQSKLIPYIIKHRKDLYDEEELFSYSYEDILEIYNEIRTEKRSWIIKLFQLFSSVD
jgi:hypothetical protein